MDIFDCSGNKIGAPNYAYNYTKWAGKTVVIHTNSLGGWASPFAEFAGMELVSILNKGGSLTANRTAAEMIEYVEQGYPDAVDLIILQGDGNSGLGGDPTDQLDGENPVNSWAGRLNYYIRCLKARYPNVVIALMVDNMWYTSNGVVDQWSVEKNRYMREQIKGIAEYNCCAYLDVDHFTPFNPLHGLNNHYTKLTADLAGIDGTHVNDNYLRAKAMAVLHHVAGLIFDPDAPNAEAEGWQDNITYTITNNLHNATNSLTAVDWAAHTKYAATITATSGTLSGVTVTMGGVDFTADVYSGGKITIGCVTGDIVITATAG